MVNGDPDAQDEMESIHSSEGETKLTKDATTAINGGQKTINNIGL